MWVGFQILASAGTALIFTATLPLTLAPVRGKKVAVATGTYSFVRSFGLVWGVTMASIVFNGQSNTRLESSTVLIGIYIHALNAVWYLMVGMVGLDFVVVCK
ncbi:hypothetical protein QBC41DRAFT_331823 [Cercophora samala]|uniref:Uncharacterized protein n=1 Tax=Cercophora samala TaxID=330535 RepID=A0AA40D3G3_9PEZI|nr:hypothetical protein QBC41DRAFT_331823 [Cercophora samala]